MEVSTTEHKNLGSNPTINDRAVTVIAFYSPSCLGQETAKGPFGLLVKLPPVYHTRRTSPYA